MATNAQGLTPQQMSAYAEDRAYQQAGERKQAQIDQAVAARPAGTTYDPSTGTYKDPRTGTTYVGSTTGQMNAQGQEQLTAAPGPTGGLRFQQNPTNPVVVSTGKEAAQDLSSKKAFLDSLTQGMLNQSQTKNMATAGAPAATETVAPTPEDTANALSLKFGLGTPSDQTTTSTATSTSSTTGPKDELTQLTDATDNAFKTYQDSINQLRNGTFPLTPDQQAQVDSTRASFDQLIGAQKIANQNYTQGITQAGIAGGRARYSPEIAMGNIQSSISAGLSKIADIETKAQATIATLRQGFDDRNYDQINKSYDKLNDYLKQKSDAIASLNKVAQEHADKMIELNYKIEQDNIQNQLKYAEFDQKQKQAAFDQAMASDKFDYTMKQDAIKNMMDSDKFSWQQKQDNIKNALEQGKFSYQQQKDLQQYQLDLKKLESADTPDSYKEWKFAGQPGSYSDYLTKKVNAKPPTADQSQSFTYAMRMKDSNDTIGNLTKWYQDQGLIGQTGLKITPGFAHPAEAQQIEQAERDFLNAVLRKESGAAISPTEFDSGAKQYFPQIGDTQAVIDQKARNRQNALKGISAEAGPAMSDELRSQINSGKTIYHSLDDYAKYNPDTVSKIDQIGKDHPNWSDDDILQLLQAPDEGGGTQGFNQPLSMGVKGSQGSLSERFESGGNPGAIGYDSTGGLSYGTYQLAHNNAKSFVNQSPYASEFAGIPFNSTAFQQKWKQIAQEDPGGFKQAQHDYIEQTHVEPQIEKIAAAGLDLADYSPVLKDVIFSTAVQHGANTDVVTKALKKLGPNPPEDKLIEAIYKERWSGGARFANSTPEVKKGVYNRFFGPNGELAMALAQSRSNMA